MTHQVLWTKTIVEEFIKEAMLSDEEEFILRTRAKGWTVTQQAEALHCSVDTINKKIALLKKKYDKVQEYDPLLRPRKSSSKELYMDTH